MIGRRTGFGEEAIEPHNATLTVLGTALLWFGWFGFNGGSALGVNGQAINAVVATNVAAATAGIVWVALGWFKHRKTSVIGAAVGAVAGLVAITPGAGYVTPISAIAIGGLTSATCFFFTENVLRNRVDDSLDVFGVHGIGGICGAILTAVFATTAAPGNTVAGLLAGNTGLCGRQLLVVLVVAGYAAFATFFILRLLRAVGGVRVSEMDEQTGLDLSQHGETVGARTA